jgi:hypothetical protein
MSGLPDAPYPCDPSIRLGMTDALRQLKRGGDMDMVIYVPHAPDGMPVITQVRDDRLNLCAVAPSPRPGEMPKTYGVSLMMTGEDAVIAGFERLIANVVLKGVQYETLS